MTTIAANGKICLTHKHMLVASPHRECVDCYSRRYTSTFLALVQILVLKGVLSGGGDSSTCLKALSCSCIHCCWMREERRRGFVKQLINVVHVGVNQPSTPLYIKFLWNLSGHLSDDETPKWEQFKQDDICCCVLFRTGNCGTPLIRTFLSQGVKIRGVQRGSRLGGSKLEEVQIRGVQIRGDPN